MRHYLTLLFVLFAFPVFAAGYSLDEELIYRINFGSAEDVRLLLEKGANPNTHSSNGDTPLAIAIYRDDSEAPGIVKALLDKGADPNAADKTKLYPIVVAVKNQKKDIVAYLLNKGAQWDVKAPDGMNLIDVAKATKNDDIIALIQAPIDKEAAYAASLRTPERFKEIVRQYAFASCKYQYWNYVLSSRQMPDKDKQTNDKIAVIKADITKMVAQIQKYYPSAPSADLQTLSNNAAQAIYDKLDEMVSNTNRADHRVGTDEDADTRCHKITDNILVDFAPSVLK